MTPDVVVDVGNTRIKWGRCQNHAVVATASLEPDDTAAWQMQRDLWRLDDGARFVVTGVHPERRGRLAEWLRQHGAAVRVVKDAAELPLVVRVEKPDHVGVDRLFDAVAANHLRSPRRGAVVVDAGSAVDIGDRRILRAIVDGIIRVECAGMPYDGSEIDDGLELTGII